MNMFKNGSDGFRKLKRNDGASKIRQPISEKRKLEARRRRFNEAFDALITRSPEPRYRKFSDKDSDGLNARLAELGYAIKAHEISDDARGLVHDIPPSFVIEVMHGKKRMGYYHSNPGSMILGGFVEINCSVGKGCVIGEKSAVLDGAVLYDNVQLAGGSVVAGGKIEHSMISNASVIDSKVVFSSISNCKVDRCTFVMCGIGKDHAEKYLVGIDVPDLNTLKRLMNGDSQSSPGYDAGEAALERFLDALLPTNGTAWRKVKTEKLESGGIKQGFP